MRLLSVRIENFRAIEHLDLPLEPRLNVLVGENASGKTSVIDAIAVGLGAIPAYLPECKGRNFQQNDLRISFELGVEHLIGSDEPDDDYPPFRTFPFPAPYSRITLETESGPTWDRTRRRDRTKGTIQLIPPGVGVAPLRHHLDPIIDSVRSGGGMILPIIACYGTDRAVPNVPQRKRNFRREFGRFAALDGALEAGFRFKDVFEWFVAQEDRERRVKEERRDFDYRLPLLEAIRKAVGRALPGCRNPRTELRPLRLVVDKETTDGRLEYLALDQLSGGYRVMLALVIDLARRMVQANPQLGTDAIDTSGIVLIDEVDLHLHPRWQQRVLPDLLRTFANLQVIVTTHSAPVLTTVKPEQIIRLDRTGRGVSAEWAQSSLGAESGRLLEEILGVEQRPPADVNEFARLFARYADLVSDDRGEESEALDLRRQLDSLSPQDPGLFRLDMEVRRRRVLRERRRAVK